jgi:hypothetical protein
MKIEDLLTPDEHKALELSGELANLLGKIIQRPEKDLPAHDERRDQFKAIGLNDWSEVAKDIHAIQHRIMAQAAARAFPKQYRLMGRNIGR